MRVLAVDFGTSNTVAALGVDGGAPRLVTIDGSPLVPSSVFLTDDGTLAVGRDADRQARIDPSRYEPNPKRRIDEGVLLLGSKALPVTTVIAEVLKRVSSEVQRQLGGPPDQVRLTHPARWGKRRQDVLVAAAWHAGLPGEPVLVPEPVAAATHFASLSGSGLADGQALAVYDLGGGTFDIAVVQRRGDGYEVLAEAGLPDLGGLDFDHAILDHIGRVHGEEVDSEAWRRLLMPTDGASRRMARALATDVRDGKEALSRYPHVDIALPPPFTDMHLTRTEFEDLIRPNLSRSIELMRRTVAESGFEPTKLAGVYLVGGSSRIPLAARLIQQGLGVTPTTLDQPETSVATGALYLGVGQASPAAAGPVAPPTGQMPVVAPGAFGPTAGRTMGGQPAFAPPVSGPGTAVPTGPPSGPQTGLPTGPHTGPQTGVQPLPQTGPASGVQPGVGPFTSQQPAAGPFSPPHPSGVQPAAQGPTSGQQAVVSGHSSGVQPAVGDAPTTRMRPGEGGYGGAAPNLPPIRPVAFPPGQQNRPGQPNQANQPNQVNQPRRPQGPPGPPTQHGQRLADSGPARLGHGGPPSGPPHSTEPGGDSKRRTILIAAGGGLAAALVAVLVVVLVTRGGDKGGGSGTGGTTTKASTSYDKYFSDPKVRSYLRPLYSQIESCKEGALGEAIAGAATCTFNNGVQITIGSTDPSVLNLDDLRQLVSTSVSATDGLSRKEGSWSGGSLDTFSSTTSDKGAALYWDRKNGNIWGLAASDTMKPTELESWWRDRLAR